MIRTIYIFLQRKVNFLVLQLFTIGKPHRPSLLVGFTVAFLGEGSELWIPLGFYIFKYEWDLLGSLPFSGMKRKKHMFTFYVRFTSAALHSPPLPIPPLLYPTKILYNPQNRVFKTYNVLKTKPLKNGISSLLGVLCNSLTLQLFFIVFQDYCGSKKIKLSLVFLGPF